MKFGLGVAEKKMFEMCERRRRRRRRAAEHGYAISSPCEPNGSGELKRLLFSTGFQL